MASANSLLTPPLARQGRGVDLEASARVRAPLEDVFGVLEDLGTYPSWLTIVGSAAPAPAHADDAGPAWQVDIVGRIGPLAKRKRVRMVRVAHDRATGLVRFERRELDGRTHSDWLLTGHALADGGDISTAVSVRIHYGGAGRIPGVELLLRQEVRGAGDRLEAYLSSRG